MMYGAEIYGWKEQKKLETIQQRYIKWTLGLDSCTPEYIVNEETGREKMRAKTGKRALKFEEKIRSDRSRILVKEVLKERETGNLKTRNIEEREQFYNRNGFSSLGLEQAREFGEEVIRRLEQREREVQAQERLSRIEKSRYNNKYIEIRKAELPGYLKDNRGKARMRSIARLRCGNEEEKNSYWLTEDKKKCVICKKAEGSIGHLIKDCEGIDRNGERILEKDILDESGNRGGYEWLISIRNIRDREKKQDEMDG